MKSEFDICEVCAATNWKNVYQGHIRDGCGTHIENAIIAQCNICGVQRLTESHVMSDEFYESGEYRTKLKQSLSNDKAIKEQDNVQKYMIQAVGGVDCLRNKTVVDVGCGAGSLLDMVKNITEACIGIEPCIPYLDNMVQKGHDVFPDINTAINKYCSSADWALSSQVIEHVKNPVTFLKEIKNLLKPGGEAMISTPNRNDVLMNLLSDFKAHFFRSHHRWYFDRRSIEYCAKEAGFAIVKTKYIHRYNIANFVHWLRDNKPKGNMSIPCLDDHADKLWATYLESTGQADNLFCHLKKPNEKESEC